MIAAILAFGALLGLLFSSADAEAGKRRRRRKSVATFPSDWRSAPSANYANLSRKACLAELGKRKIAHQRVAAARGVLAPVRVPDGIDGVLYRTAVSRARRASNPHDVFDCRLVLALDDFSDILRQHHVEEVLIFSSWRPPSKRWPRQKIARRHPGALAVDIFRLIKSADAPPWTPDARTPATAVPKTAAPSDAGGKDAAVKDAAVKDAAVKDAGGKDAAVRDEAASAETTARDATPPLRQSPVGSKAAKQPLKYPGGRAAVDLQAVAPRSAKRSAEFPQKRARTSNRVAERRYLEVERDFKGTLGATTCGNAAGRPQPSTPEARELRAIVCEAAEARLFTSMLTPHYDRAHFNHLHLELAPKVKWRIVR